MTIMIECHRGGYVVRELLKGDAQVATSALEVLKAVAEVLGVRVRVTLADRIEVGEE